MTDIASKIAKIFIEEKSHQSFEDTVDSIIRRFPNVDEKTIMRGFELAMKIQTAAAEKNGDPADWRSVAAELMRTDTDGVDKVAREGLISSVTEVMTEELAKLRATPVAGMSNDELKKLRSQIRALEDGLSS